MFEADKDFVESLTILSISKKEALVFAYLIYKGGAPAKEMITDSYIHPPSTTNSPVV
jgi:sugar-specific transcriptional regulator TrmB